MFAKLEILGNDDFEIYGENLKNLENGLERLKELRQNGVESLTRGVEVVQVGEVDLSKLAKLAKIPNFSNSSSMFDLEGLLDMNTEMKNRSQGNFEDFENIREKCEKKRDEKISDLLNFSSIDNLLGDLSVLESHRSQKNSFKNAENLENQDSIFFANKNQFSGSNNFSIGDMLDIPNDSNVNLLEDIQMAKMPKIQKIDLNSKKLDKVGKKNIYNCTETPRTDNGRNTAVFVLKENFDLTKTPNNFKKPNNFEISKTLQNSTQFQNFSKRPK